MAAFTAESIQNIITDNERVRAAFVNQRGLSDAPAAARRELATPVALVVTDRRLIFASPAGEDYTTIALAYGDLASIDVSRGASDRVTLTTMDGDTWTYRFPVTAREMLDAVGNHLQWIGEVRKHVITFRNDAEIAAGRIRAAVNERNWDAAREEYTEVRDAIDQLICAVQFTEPIEDDVLAPELTDIEWTLEDAHVRLYLDHAKSELELGQFLIENVEYDRANEVLQRAHRFYKIARDQSDEVKRGDAFEFGTQRELNEEIQRLGWEIETVAAEPVRQAQEAKLLAEAADDPGEAATHWETVYHRFQEVLRLDWGGTDGSLVTDPVQARTEFERAGQRLVNIHYQLARSLWNDGAAAQRDGSIKTALEHCLAAKDHLESARTIASEVEYGNISDMDTRREKMIDTIYKLRRMEYTGDDGEAHQSATTGGENDTEKAESPRSGPTGASGESAGAGKQPDGAIPNEATTSDEDSAGDLADIPTIDDLVGLDVHHDITLNLSGGDGPTIGADEETSNATDRRSTILAGEDTDNAPERSTDAGDDSEQAKQSRWMESE